jgi:glutathione S-transferase
VFALPIINHARIRASPCAALARSQPTLEATMKIYDSMGPNPRALRMFLFEKGIKIPTAAVDLLGAENRQPPYTDRNPGGQIPALELDDGRVLGETVAIFEYLEEKHPTPPLIGTTAEERAETRMWQRRVELNITENLYNAFRYAEGLALFQSRMRCLPEAADGLKAIVRDKLVWLDGLMAGKPFVAGKRFTIADIILYCALDFGATVGQSADPALGNLAAWMTRVAARPSANASLHEAAASMGMRG